jgi:hypothetical protein
MFGTNVSNKYSMYFFAVFIFSENFFNRILASDRMPCLENLTFYFRFKLLWFLARFFAVFIFLEKLSNRIFYFGKMP